MTGRKLFNVSVNAIERVIIFLLSQINFTSLYNLFNSHNYLNVVKRVRYFYCKGKHANEE